LISPTAEITRKAAKLMRLSRHRSYVRALRFGVAATVEHEGVPFDPALRTIIDVGAGRGQFALFARHRFPAAQIFSFEPLPDSFAKASRVLADARVDLRPIAIGAAGGQAVVHVTEDRDSSSLLAPTPVQTNRFPGTSEVAEVSVAVRTLDESFDSVQRPVLLKLDLQGGELDALRGAANLLSQVKEVFVECSFVELYSEQPLAEDVISHLTGNGFALRGIFSPTYGEDGECIQADLLFERT
jgi:FkbM family methyltransferase